jgi:hypothetical protein
MPSDTVTLTREELYEKVWTTPIHKLSQEFGISDVGLAKLCRRHKIPVPGRGYWARLAAGQKQRRTPLPKIEDAHLRTVEIHRTKRPTTEGVLMVAKQPAPVIEVADDRPIAHPIAIEVDRSLIRSTDEKGLLQARKGRVVPLAVSLEQLPRALRVFDALLGAVDSAGYALSWPKPYDKPLKVIVLEEELAFSISEIAKAQPHELTPQEKSHPWTAPHWDYHPTGRLKLSIDCRTDVHIRHSWADGKFLRVEKCLGRFLVALPEIARTIRIEREERERQRREWEEQRKRMEEARRQREEYERKAKVLQKLAHDFEESRLVSEFAAALKRAAESPDTPDEKKAELASIADFAIRHVHYLDPLTDLKWMLDQFKNPPWSYGYR